MVSRLVYCTSQQFLALQYVDCKSWFIVMPMVSNFPHAWLNSGLQSVLCILSTIFQIPFIMYSGGFLFSFGSSLITWGYTGKVIYFYICPCIVVVRFNPDEQVCVKYAMLVFRQRLPWVSLTSSSGGLIAVSTSVCSMLVYLLIKTRKRRIFLITFLNDLLEIQGIYQGRPVVQVLRALVCQTPKTCG